MKANEYLVMNQAVEDGVAYGWMRAHKHVENPTEDQIKDAIVEGVMSTICQWFMFDRDWGAE